MDQQIAALKQWLQHDQYADQVVVAIIDYVTGHGSLGVVEHAWQTAGPGKGQLQSYTFRRRHGTSPDHLDDIDLRMLDVCTVLGKVDHFVQSIANTELLPQMQAYLRTRGWTDEAILQAAAESMKDAATHLDVISPLGRFLQAHLPQHFESIEHGTVHHRDRLKLITLLLDMQPPLIDLAEETFHRIQGAGKGEAVTRLFRADPVRFTALARQVAGPNNQLDAKERLTALQALIAHDSANNVDLAVAAARSSPTLGGGQAANELRNFGLAAAFRHDPLAYLPWVEAIALGDHHHHARWAVELLGDIDPHLSRPILQRCVAGKDVKIAWNAMHKLLEQPDGDEAYMISLLAHRSDYIRDRVSGWLARRGGV